MSKTSREGVCTRAVVLALALLGACGDDASGPGVDAGGSGTEDGGGTSAPDPDASLVDAGGRDGGGGDAGGSDAGGDAPDGAECAQDTECASGQCVDGVCCESACDGVCEHCNADGRCEKPADDSACGTIDCDAFDEACRDYHDLDANRCAARGECKVSQGDACDDFTDAVAGTACSDPYCDGANAVAVDECDGAGACDPDSTPTACGDYVCHPAGCPTSCASGDDCVVGLCERRDGTCPATASEADCTSDGGALADAIAACPATPTCYVLVKGTCDPVVFQDKDVYLGSDGTGTVHDASNGTGIEAYEAPAGAETRLVLDDLAVTSTGFNSGGSGVVCWALAGEVAQMWTFDTSIHDVGTGLQASRCDVIGSGDVVEDCFEPVQLAFSTSSFTECTVRRGSDEGIGAANSTLTLTNCDVSDNTGQGLLSNSCTVTVTGTRFSGNDNTQVSASNGSNVMISGSSIANGSSNGVAASSLAAVTLEGVTVEGNTGRGVTLSGATAVIDDSTVHSNLNEGIEAQNASTLTLRRSTIAENTLRGILATDSNFTLLNNIIVGNDSDGVRVSSTAAITKVFRHNTVVGNGAGMQCSGAEGIATIERSLFSNTPNTEVAGCTVDTTSDVPGTADSCADGTMAPIFVSAAGGDYHLGALSGCIDAVACDGTTGDDFDFQSRPIGSMCDVGADEAP